MRAILGLVGILVVVGVIVWWMGSGGGLDRTQQVLQTGQKSREQVNQISGNDPETGARASDSAELEAMRSGGKLDGILVTSVTPGGAFEQYFGLKRSDTIVAVVYQGNRMNVKDLNDEEMAKAQVVEAYSKKGSLVVVRDDREITLPQAPAGAQPAAAGEQPKKSGDPLQQQLDAIQGIPGAQ